MVAFNLDPIVHLWNKSRKHLKRNANSSMSSWTVNIIGLLGLAVLLVAVLIPLWILPLGGGAKAAVTICMVLLAVYAVLARFIHWFFAVARSTRFVDMSSSSSTSLSQI